MYSLLGPPYGILVLHTDTKTPILWLCLSIPVWELTRRVKAVMNSHAHGHRKSGAETEGALTVLLPVDARHGGLDRDLRRTCVSRGVASESHTQHVASDSRTHSLRKSHALQYCVRASAQPEQRGEEETRSPGNGKGVEG
eukprot:2958966-Rhodomonas_salina.1